MLAAGALAVTPAASAARIQPGVVFAIPSIGVHGRLASNLAAGPVLWWHDKDTLAVAGHDVTPVPGYGAHGPFWNLYLVKPGDLIRVGDRVYRARYVLTLRPNAMWTLHWKGLVLSGCWPRYSAAFRKVVLARPVR